MTSNFSDFIGVFDGYVSKDLCQKIIEAFEKAKSAGRAISRQQENPQRSALSQDDEACSLINEDPQLANEFGRIFWDQIYPAYAQEYPIVSDLDHHVIKSLKLQKTTPTGGYHMWHCEQGAYAVAERMMAFSLYLNDVEFGGETEFLYQKRRLEAKQGRVALWPAGYTHTHRGNPPYSGDKYILTGWVVFEDPDALQNL
jgi:hypothetical protein